MKQISIAKGNTNVAVNKGTIVVTKRTEGRPVKMEYDVEGNVQNKINFLLWHHCELPTN